MVSLKQVLYKTRKSILEVCSEFDVYYHSDIEIGLEQCVSCGIWLTERELIPDLDKNLICKHCDYAYGK